jgi:exopolyphosphatase/pppGpp-phosphohydrolase
LELAPDALTVHWRERTTTLPIGVAQVHARWLTAHDPPRPESLTNAIGEIADHLDDLLRDHPELGEVATAHVHGPAAWAIVRLETGLDDPPAPAELDRDTVEEVFRLAATESRADRAHNPGLPSGDVETVLAALCIVVGAMRRLTLERVLIGGGAATDPDLDG